MRSNVLLVICIILSIISCKKEDPPITNAEINTPQWLHGQWVMRGDGPGGFYAIDTASIHHKTFPGFFDNLFLGHKGYEFRCELEIKWAVAQGNLTKFDERKSDFSYELIYKSEDFDKTIKLRLDGDTLREYRLDHKNPDYGGHFKYVRR